MFTKTLVVAAAAVIPAVHAVPKELIGAQLHRYTGLSDVNDASSKWENSNFQSPVDHNDPSQGTYQNRFLYNTQYWDKKSPIMFYLYGEAPLDTPFGNTSLMAEIAKQHNSAVVTIEHRWFGDSLPGSTSDLPLLKKTLTVEQAMADVPTLIAHMEKEVFKGTFEWYLVGGSYSGAMTIWMLEEQGHPEKFIGGWAASGVVQPTLAFTEYDGHVKKVTEGECADDMMRVVSAVTRLWSSNHTAMCAHFGDCGPTLVGFQAHFLDSVAGGVQYSHRVEICEKIVKVIPSDPSTSDWELLMAWTHIFGLDNNMNLIKKSREPEDYFNAWQFLCCNELGWAFMGYPDSLTWPGVHLGYTVDVCRDMKMDTIPDVWGFNLRWGGKNPKIAKNMPVIATQGSDDPWSTQGLMQDTNSIEVSIAECPDCGHCRQMGPLTPSVPSLYKSQMEVMKYFEKLLG